MININDQFRNRASHLLAAVRGLDSFLDGSLFAARNTSLEYTLSWTSARTVLLFGEKSWRSLDFPP